MNDQTETPKTISDPWPTPGITRDITQEKLSAREQVIAKLSTLLSESFEMGMGKQGRGGEARRQKWFSISASLAHTLARLVSDLEYEKLRLEVDDLKKMVLEGNVSSSKIAVPPSRHEPDPKKCGEERASGNPN